MSHMQENNQSDIEKIYERLVNFNMNDTSLLADGAALFANKEDFNRTKAIFKILETSIDPNSYKTAFGQKMASDFKEYFNQHAIFMERFPEICLETWEESLERKTTKEYDDALYKANDPLLNIAHNISMELRSIEDDYTSAEQQEVQEFLNQLLMQAQQMDRTLTTIRKTKTLKPL